jgi:hypothetical protein
VFQYRNGDWSAIGSTIKLHFSMNMLFYASSVFALLSIVILMNMKETLKHKHRFSLHVLKISRKDIIAKEVLPGSDSNFPFLYGIWCDSNTDSGLEPSFRNCQ